MKAKLFTSCLFFCCLGAMAQTEVTGYVSGRNSDGVTYFLPKTALKLTLKAEKTTFTPGEFSRYAEKYLRLTNVSTQTEEHWTIQSVTVTPVGVPDTEKVFTVKLKEKTSAPLMELTEDGIVKSINTTYPVAPVQAEAAPAAEKVLNPKDYMTEEILMAGSTAKMAELTAKEIYNIRESKNTITRGQAESMPKDGESLRIMLNSLEEQERALLQLFTGTTTKTQATKEVRLLPTEEINKQIVLRFSDQLGCVEADNLAGEPIYLSLTDQHTVTPPTDEERAKKKFDGVIYNVPGKADLLISFGNKELFKGEVVLAQFGNEEVLSSNLFNKKTTTKVIFDPTTGGLVKIDAENP
jgi:hypothetical protein